MACACMWILNSCVIENWPNPFQRKVLLYWRAATALFCIVSALKLYMQCVMLQVSAGNLTAGQVRGEARRVRGAACDVCV